MENVTETHLNSKGVDNANDPANYITLVVGIAIIMIGVLLRFFGAWAMIDIVSNIILLAGLGVSLKSVYNILH